jgi:hypothetical protein
MPEESYEMARSQSGTSSDHHNEAYDGREEEAQLLNKEQSDSDLEDEDDEDLDEDDEAWAIIVEETGTDNGRDYEKVFFF